jgi:hypothetical protein
MGESKALIQVNSDASALFPLPPQYTGITFSNPTALVDSQIAYKHYILHMQLVEIVAKWDTFWTDALATFKGSPNLSMWGVLLHNVVLLHVSDIAETVNHFLYGHFIAWAYYFDFKMFMSAKDFNDLIESTFEQHLMNMKESESNKEMIRKVFELTKQAMASGARGYAGREDVKKVVMAYAEDNNKQGVEIVSNAPNLALANSYATKAAAAKTAYTNLNTISNTAWGTFATSLSTFKTSGLSADWAKVIVDLVFWHIHRIAADVQLFIYRDSTTWEAYWHYKTF